MTSSDSFKILMTHNYYISCPETIGTRNIRQKFKKLLPFSRNRILHCWTKKHANKTIDKRKCKPGNKDSESGAESQKTVIKNFYPNSIVAKIYKNSKFLNIKSKFYLNIYEISCFYGRTFNFCYLDLFTNENWVLKSLFGEL